MVEKVSGTQLFKIRSVPPARDKLGSSANFRFANPCNLPADDLKS